LEGLTGVGAGEFGDQLGAFILQAEAAVMEGRARGDVSGNYGLRNGEQLAGLKINAFRGEFTGDDRIVNANCERWLTLAVEADSAGGFNAVVADPALDHPRGVREGESQIRGGVGKRNWLASSGLVSQLS